MIDKYVQERLPIMFEVAYDLLKLDGDMIMHRQDYIKGGPSGQVKLNNDYMIHKVKINPQRSGNEYQTLETVVHECVHVALVRYHTFAEIIWKYLPDKQSKKAMQKAFTHFEEQTVVHMTRVLIEAAWTMYINKLKELGMSLPEGVEDDDE